MSRALVESRGYATQLKTFLGVVIADVVVPRHIDGNDAQNSLMFDAVVDRSNLNDRCEVEKRLMRGHVLDDDGLPGARFHSLPATLDSVRKQRNVYAHSIPRAYNILILSKRKFTSMTLEELQATLQRSTLRCRSAFS